MIMSVLWIHRKWQCITEKLGSPFYTGTNFGQLSSKKIQRQPGDSAAENNCYQVSHKKIKLAIVYTPISCSSELCVRKKGWTLNEDVSQARCCQGVLPRKLGQRSSCRPLDQNRHRNVRLNDSAYYLFQHENCHLLTWRPL
jgi:hypothetical protein